MANTHTHNPKMATKYCAQYNACLTPPNYSFYNHTPPKRRLNQPPSRPNTPVFFWADSFFALINRPRAMPPIGTVSLYRSSPSIGRSSCPELAFRPRGDSFGFGLRRSRALTASCRQALALALAVAASEAAESRALPRSVRGARLLEAVFKPAG